MRLNSFDGNYGFDIMGLMLTVIFVKIALFVVKTQVYRKLFGNA